MQSRLMKERNLQSVKFDIFVYLLICFIKITIFISESKRLG